MKTKEKVGDVRLLMSGSDRIHQGEAQNVEAEAARTNPQPLIVRRVSGMQEAAQFAAGNFITHRLVCISMSSIRACNACTIRETKTPDLFRNNRMSCVRILTSQCIWYCSTTNSKPTADPSSLNAYGTSAFRASATPY